MHISLSTRIYALCPQDCFENLENVNISMLSNNICKINTDNAKLLTLEEFTLNSSTTLNIQNIFQDSNPTAIQSRKTLTPPGNKTESETQHVPINDCWTKCGRIGLTKKDKQQILNGKELTDMHVNAFQNIARVQFSLTGGLHNTLLLYKTSLTLENYEQSL